MLGGLLIKQNRVLCNQFRQNHVQRTSFDDAHFSLDQCADKFLCKAVARGIGRAIVIGKRTDGDDQFGSLRLHFVTDFKLDLEVADQSGLRDILRDLRNLEFGDSRSFAGQHLACIRVDDVALTTKHGHFLSNSHSAGLSQSEIDDLRSDFGNLASRSLTL